MVNFLAFDAECEQTFLPRMGGGTCLPKEVEWPRDKEGEPMLHLLTLPSNIVNIFSDCNLPTDHCISVFIPYRHDSIDYAIDLARKPGAAFVIAHKTSMEIRQECKYPLLPPHEIKIDCDKEAEDEDEFSDEIDSKIGGGPVWLQDRLEISDKKFLLQLVGAMIGNCWPSHKGMFLGGIGYLFIDGNFDYSKSRFGEFRVQFS